MSNLLLILGDFMRLLAQKTDFRAIILEKRSIFVGYVSSKTSRNCHFWAKKEHISAYILQKCHEITHISQKWAQNCRCIAGKNVSKLPEKWQK